MDKRLCFARTEKGREELLGGGRTLKPRQRQVLFLVGETVSVGSLQEKLPACQELEGILEQLWEGGYIGQVKSAGHSAAPIIVDASPLDAARNLALRSLATLVGEHSPAYAQVAQTQDATQLLEATAAARKLIAAVASAQQAASFEQSVLTLLRPLLGPGPINGIDSAKQRALEIICSLVGNRSPVYVKVDGAHNRADFIEAVAAGKKVIAAVASASHAQQFETEVLSLLEDH